MKKLVLLFLFASLAFGQGRVPITPAIATEKIDSIYIVLGSKNVSSTTSPFSGITAGMRVQGPMFPIGTTVKSNTSDSLLVLSDAARMEGCFLSSGYTDSSGLDSLRFEKLDTTTYTAGDALGFPFQVPGGMNDIKNVIVVDDAKQIVAVKLVFFRDAFTQSFDNAPFAICDSEANGIIGYMNLTTSEVFTNNQLVTGAATTLPIYLGHGKVYCQMICVGTPKFTAVDNLHVTFIGD